MYKTMKIYYDNETGEMLWNTAHDYYFTPNFDRDYEVVDVLRERVKASIGLLTLTDGQYAQDFREGRLIGVNVESKVPIFEYPNLNEPLEPIVPNVPFSESINANTDYLLDVDFRLMLVELGM